MMLHVSIAMLFLRSPCFIAVFVQAHQVPAGTKHVCVDVVTSRGHDQHDGSFGPNAICCTTFPMSLAVQLIIQICSFQ